MCLNQLDTVWIFFTSEDDTFITGLFRVGTTTANRLARLDAQLLFGFRILRSLRERRNKDGGGKTISVRQQKGTHNGKSTTNKRYIGGIFKATSSLNCTTIPPKRCKTYRWWWCRCRGSLSHCGICLSFKAPRVVCSFCASATRPPFCSTALRTMYRQP